MRNRVRAAGISLLLLLALAACTEGAYDDPEVVAITSTPDGGDSDSGSGDGGAAEPALDCRAFFASKVQPELDYCRSCHVPGGVGDVPDGDDLQFSDDRDEDLSRLHAGWQQLGGNNPTSRILTMAAGTDTQSHSGGSPWPVDGEVYNDVETLLQGFESGWCEDALAVP